MDSMGAQRAIVVLLIERTMIIYQAYLIPNLHIKDDAMMRYQYTLKLLQIWH